MIEKVSVQIEDKALVGSWNWRIPDGGAQTRKPREAELVVDISDWPFSDIPSVVQRLTGQAKVGSTDYSVCLQFLESSGENYLFDVLAEPVTSAAV